MFRSMVTGSLVLAAGCEPVGVDAARGAAEAAEPRASIARAQVMRALAREPENLRMHHLHDGTQLAEVVRGFQHATIVTKGDAGLEHHCLTNPEEAVRLLEGRAK